MPNQEKRHADHSVNTYLIIFRNGIDSTGFKNSNYKSGMDADKNRILF